MQLTVTPAEIPAGQQIQLVVHAAKLTDPATTVAGSVWIDGVQADATDKPIPWTFHSKSSVRVTAAGYEDGWLELPINLKQLNLSVDPGTPLPVGTPVTFIIRAVDHNTNTLVGGRALSNGQYRGETNTPIPTIFRGHGIHPPLPPLIGPGNGDQGDGPGADGDGTLLPPVGTVVAPDYVITSIPWLFEPR